MVRVDRFAAGVDAGAAVAGWFIVHPEAERLGARPAPRVLSVRLAGGGFDGPHFDSNSHLQAVLSAGCAVSRDSGMRGAAPPGVCAGLYDVGSRLGSPDRPWWPVLIVSLLTGGCLAKTLIEGRDEFCWRDAEQIAAK